MMKLSEHFPLILEGFLGNLLIVGVTFACVFPLGLLLSFLASRNKTVGKVFNWISLPFECFSILVILFFVYFGIPYVFKNLFDTHVSVNALTATLITYCICFIGYMPARYDPNSSFLKNILYNGLGLISSVLKWSFVAQAVGAPEMINMAQNVIAITFKSFEVWSFVFICIFFFILPLEIGKRLIKNLMK